MLRIVEEESNYIKALNSRSREFSGSANELAAIHKSIGMALGERITNQWPVKAIEIKNAENRVATGNELDHSKVTLITMMRAGLFLSLGIRETLGNGFVHLLSDSVDDLTPEYVNNRDIILADSVINSGASVERYINALSNAKSITVASLVMQSGFIPKAQEKYASIEFHTGRVSENYYVGSGTNDTGNRLFGTV